MSPDNPPNIDEQDWDRPIVVEYDDLYELYSSLEDATTAAATGDPNTVSKKAAEAKRKVLEIHEYYMDRKESTDR